MQQTILKCPKCKTDLHEFEFEPGTYFDHCRSCKGLWLGQGELVAVAPTKADVTRLQGQLRLMGVGKLICPACVAAGTVVAMQACTQQSPDSSQELEVDYCQSCKGLWLDKSELAQIRAVMKELRVSEKLERLKSLSQKKT